MPIAISQKFLSWLISLKCCHVESLFWMSVGALMAGPAFLLRATKITHSGAAIRKGPMLIIAMIVRQFQPACSSGAQIHGITTPPVLVAVSTMPMAAP